MSNIDKRALREDALEADEALQIMKSDIEVNPGHVDSINAFYSLLSPKSVLALLDELEAAEKRIAELSHHLQCAHAFVEHTEAFGHEASNGILCCGDAQWNIDASKSALAAVGKGEAS
ncbi:ead/Ea22-like family protein [Escherichia coli]|nr:ead/Ea22-like family protein [Escherichia coli]